MTYPKCRAAELLRPSGKRYTVSSMALHAMLGETQYQQFIRHNAKHPLAWSGNSDPAGFNPVVVEAWLGKH